MKLTPRYDYYLNIDGRFYPIPYTVFTLGDRIYLKVKDTQPSLVASDEDELYVKFENHLDYSIRRFHLNGELWKFFPNYTPGFSAETARLVAYPHQTLRKKIINRIKYLFRKWNL